MHWKHEKESDVRYDSEQCQTGSEMEACVLDMNGWFFEKY
jgi:hypothetical protein